MQQDWGCVRSLSRSCKQRAQWRRAYALVHLAPVRSVSDQVMPAARATGLRDVTIWAICAGGRDHVHTPLLPYVAYMLWIIHAWVPTKPLQADFACTKARQG